MCCVKIREESYLAREWGRVRGRPLDQSCLEWSSSSPLSSPAPSFSFCLSPSSPGPVIHYSRPLLPLSLFPGPCVALLQASCCVLLSSLPFCSIPLQFPLLISPIFPSFSLSPLLIIILFTHSILLKVLQSSEIMKDR